MKRGARLIAVVCLLLIGASVSGGVLISEASGQVGSSRISTAVNGVEGDSTVIKPGSSLFLEPNFPNPFTNTTQIAYTLDRETKVLLEVFDAFYNQVLTLVEMDSQGPGRYEIDFAPNGEFASGMYLYSLTTSEGTQVRRMLFLR